MILRELAALAQGGRFAEFLPACRQYLAEAGDKLNNLLDVGALLSDFGFLGEARECYERACAIAPDDLRAMVNLANLARDGGDHAESQRLYAGLLARLPNHAVIRRNALLSLEYDPAVSDAERLNQAKAWGEWAITQAGGARPRPPMQDPRSRPLRVGYVSADLCQHTVGLLVKDVFRAHDAGRVEVYTYSAGAGNDWVTQAIQSCTRFCDVRRLDDAALAERIRQDGIDVLVDLSGHTAGSRLTVFAHRPAPLLVSWLGYFASTGLDCIDAVLLDKWHAPNGAEVQFVEPILRLPSRFCYSPVPWMPSVPPRPDSPSRPIHFGSFNNTSKYNHQVFELWARILVAVPKSRLILKWKSFNDPGYRDAVRGLFSAHGITADRLELHPASFHSEMLDEYIGVDIGLDPFPFSGGMTSCESLWMGVPVITWPQSRPVSRQTSALLSIIGYPEWVAHHADDYVRIAVNLASDRRYLDLLRQDLRKKMQDSPLCNTRACACSLEDAFISEYERIYKQQETQP